jgi:hypothetical protein
MHLQGGKATLPVASIPGGRMLQRFVLVVDGLLRVRGGKQLRLELEKNYFLFCPDHSACNLTSDDANLLVFERLVASEVVQGQQIQHGFVEDSPLLDTGVH